MDQKNFDRFLQDTVSILVLSDSSTNKKLINRILKATYDHVAIGWPSIRPEIFMPWKVTCTTENKLISFNEEPRLIEMDIIDDPMNITGTKFMTEQDRLNSLEPQQRYLINLIKAFVNSWECALIIHRDILYECSQMYIMPHLHIIVKRHVEKLPILTSSMTMK